LQATRIPLLVLAAVLAATLATGTAAAAGPCSVAGLRASFSYVPGSNATGHELYRLRITTSGSPCTLEGAVTLELLGAAGRRLPTRLHGRIALGTITAAGRGVELELSPDLYASGEPARGPCEPAARRIRVRTAAGVLGAPVTPPTPVCAFGSLTVIHA
jgi:hypothetical protein